MAYFIWQLQIYNLYSCIHLSCCFFTIYSLNATYRVFFIFRAIIGVKQLNRAKILKTFLQNNHVVYQFIDPLKKVFLQIFTFSDYCVP